MYVYICDYVNICMCLVLLCIFGKKLLRAWVYCYTKIQFKYSFLILSYLMMTTTTSLIWYIRYICLKFTVPQ